MATTWMKALHTGKTRTSRTAIADIIGYVQNPDKTDYGRLITSFACDSRTADEEFILSKHEYEYITGRNQGRRDVIAYHIRQSFKPGEVSPETANKIGYDLVTSFTKGKHAFVVCTHIDKKHVHNHIIFNSTTLDCERKFKDFWFSGMAVRRISDLLCLQNGLSVIENPEQGKSKSYGDWLGDNKPASGNEKIKRQIDEILQSCVSFEDFLNEMRTAGYEVNDKGKHITILAPGNKKPRRLDTLKGNYTQAAIRERIADANALKISGTGGGQIRQSPVPTPIPTPVPNRINLLIDIQAKLREGRGLGYEQWSKIFNLKQAAKTLVFLSENGIDSYEDLKKKSSSASGEFAARVTRIRDVEERLKNISEMQKYIGKYSKTREVYAKYKASGWNKDFYESNRADITIHRAAKKYFDSLNLKKLPRMAALKQEYAALAAEKKKLYSGYHELKEISRSLAVAKANADRILGIVPNDEKRAASLGSSRYNSHENR